MNDLGLGRHAFCVAPMMDWTDRHDRYFLRLLSKHALLYTEMVTAVAVIRGNRQRLLGYHADEHPIALQLGGSDPAELAEAAVIGEDFGYDEINLNVGCPSDRVQSGMFGACLMANPPLVAECVAAMQARVKVPVTVKHRIGIDDMDSWEHLEHFVDTVAQTGCDTFVLHARKAILQGLSPKENRDVPPLKYDWAHRLKARFPQLTIVLNGGLKTLEEGLAHCRGEHALDGTMYGREAYHNPYLLAAVDRLFYGETAPMPSRLEVLEALIPYIEQQMADGAALKHITRHILGLFQGQPGARRWRRTLSEKAHLPEADIAVVREAMAGLAG